MRLTMGHGAYALRNARRATTRGDSRIQREPIARPLAIDVCVIPIECLIGP